MKCKECSACIKGYYETKPNIYFCIGVKNPFAIKDINSQCTQYLEKNSVEYK